VGQAVAFCRLSRDSQTQTAKNDRPRHIPSLKRYHMALMLNGIGAIAFFSAVE
jgi:hypothetical protein